MKWEIPCKKILIMELMGKHSNIIFCDENRMILDSIKHVSSHMSSVREVLPGTAVFSSSDSGKVDPLTITRGGIYADSMQKALQYFQGALFFPYGFKPSYCRGNLLPRIH